MPIAPRSRPLKRIVACAFFLTISAVSAFPAHTRPQAGAPAAIPASPLNHAGQASPTGTPTKSASPQSANSSADSASLTVKTDLKKAKQADKQGLRAEQQGDWQAAYEAYVDAVNWAPRDASYFAQREIAKSHVVQMKADLAERHAISGEIPAALRILREARELDPSNKVIRERLTELAALDPRPTKGT